jgi:hypothetical protein
MIDCRIKEVLLYYKGNDIKDRMGGHAACMTKTEINTKFAGIPRCR